MSGTAGEKIADAQDAEREAAKKTRKPDQMGTSAGTSPEKRDEPTP
jgi:hypothetical protein